MTKTRRIMTYKMPAVSGPTHEVAMHQGAKILRVSLIGPRIRLDADAMVDDDENAIGDLRRFQLIPAGEPVPTSNVYVGTVQTVFHLYHVFEL